MHTYDGMVEYRILVFLSISEPDFHPTSTKMVKMAPFAAVRARGRFGALSAVRTGIRYSHYASPVQPCTRTSVLISEGIPLVPQYPSTWYPSIVVIDTTVDLAVGEIATRCFRVIEYSAVL